MAKTETESSRKLKLVASSAEYFISRAIDILSHDKDVFEAMLRELAVIRKRLKSFGKPKGVS
jgi:hypothetical protein